MSAAPQPPPPSRLRPLSTALATSFHHSDAVLLRLNTLLSTPSGIDITLCTLSYFLTFLSATLHRRLASVLERMALQVAEKAESALLPGETVITSMQAPQGLAKMARVMEGSKKLGDLVGDFRIFVRLWGLLPIYLWARGTWRQPPSDRVVKATIWAQILVNTLYQAMENVAYLASHGVLNSARWRGEEGAARQTWWWIWSSRFWAAHVGLDFLRLGREWQLQVQKKNKKVVESGEEGEKEEKLAREEEGKERARWWREFVVNAAYAPLVVHWSVEEGCISDSVVGLLGTIAGSAGLRQMWKDTRRP